MTHAANGATVTANLVVLPGRQWLEELTGELTRLGVDPEKAPASARSVLQHICARAGWPRECYRVVVSDSSYEPALSRPDEDAE